MFERQHNAGLAALALFDALPRNTHLETLDCNYNQARIDEPFATGVLLPAVRANKSLRALSCRTLWITPAGREEAVRLVHSRAQQRAG